MPGMLATILDVGLNPQTVRGLMAFHVGSQQNRSPAMERCHRACGMKSSTPARIAGWL
jgi:hypothetical protein